MRLRLLKMLKIHQHKFIRLTIYCISSVVCSTALAAPEQANQPLTMKPVARSISIEYPTQIEIKQSENQETISNCGLTGVRMGRAKAQRSFYYMVVPVLMGVMDNYLNGCSNIPGYCEHKDGMF